MPNNRNRRKREQNRKRKQLVTDLPESNGEQKGAKFTAEKDLLALLPHLFNPAPQTDSTDPQKQTTSSAASDTKDETSKPSLEEEWEMVGGIENDWTEIKDSQSGPKP